MYPRQDKLLFAIVMMLFAFFAADSYAAAAKKAAAAPAPAAPQAACTTVADPNNNVIKSYGPLAPTGAGEEKVAESRQGGFKLSLVADQTGHTFVRVISISDTYVAQQSGLEKATFSLMKAMLNAKPIELPAGLCAEGNKLYLDIKGNRVDVIPTGDGYRLAGSMNGMPFNPDMVTGVAVH